MATMDEWKTVKLLEELCGYGLHNICNTNEAVLFVIFHPIKHLL
jgi:hypothetical protein